MMLIRLRGCADWSVPLLFAYGINRFSHDAVHMQAQCVKRKSLRRYPDAVKETWKSGGQEGECRGWTGNYCDPASNIVECHATLYSLSYKSVYNLKPNSQWYSRNLFSLRPRVVIILPLLQDKTEFVCVMKNPSHTYLKINRGLHGNPWFRMVDAGMKQFSSQLRHSPSLRCLLYRNMMLHLWK